MGLRPNRAGMKTQLAAAPAMDGATPESLPLTREEESLP
jgi:hypothetical protein